MSAPVRNLFPRNGRRSFFTTKTQGLGLGLNLAEKIIETHQGRLDLVGEIGTGVRATISLPVPC